jgi:hypothetical protein
VTTGPATERPAPNGAGDLPEIRVGRHRSVDAVVTVNGLPEPAAVPSDPGQVLMAQMAADLWPHRAEVAAQVLATARLARRRAWQSNVLKSLFLQLLGLGLIVLALLDDAPQGLRLLSGWPLVSLIVVGGALVLAGPLVARISTPDPPTHAEALSRAMDAVLVERAATLSATWQEDTPR